MWIWLQVTNERNLMQARILKCNCLEFSSFHVFLCLKKFIFAKKFININPTCLLHLIVVYYIELHD
jgi:hypothetical protein